MTNGNAGMILRVLLETSRGCWWGQKKNCSFCGLNGKRLNYRSKSPERVLSELETLSGKYGIYNFLAVDNILDMGYFKTLLPLLSRGENRFFIGYSAKANLSRREVRLLADAGVLTIQPGIESLNNQVLELLNKGTTSWINLQLLKWTREFAIRTNWVLLRGFPGESDHWFSDMATIIPLISHLQPSMNIHRIFYTRFSDYYNHQEKYNLELQPNPLYSYVYPLSGEDLENFALLFTEKNPGPGHEMATGTVNAGGVKKLIAELVKWQQIWHPFITGQKKNTVELCMEENHDALFITDTRPCARETHILLEGLPARIYKICDVAATLSQILSILKKTGYTEVTWDETKSILEELRRKNILLKLEDRFLSLAVRKSNYKYTWEYGSGQSYSDKKIETVEKESSRSSDVPVSFGMDKSLKELFGNRE
ncbi:MAG: RiPP maturation radical SAM protein 1 [bacterium]|nr:RiPP maturation radical SAM protein 1 [bacterium]